MNEKQEKHEDKQLSRRTFVRGLGLGAAATLLPSAAHAQDAPPVTPPVTPPPIQFEAVPNWAKVPETLQLGFTHSVQVTRDGRVIVHNQSKDAVAFFDADGKFIKAWGPEFQGGAHGMQLASEGNDEALIFADYARHLVLKTTLDGQEIWRIAWPQKTGLYQNEGQFKPTNVAVAPNGDVYMADGYGLGYVHQYNAKGEYLRTFGGSGNEVGKFRCPHGIAVDTRGAQPRLLVADRENNRVQSFALDGSAPAVAFSDLRRPCHFAQSGEWLLIPELSGRVTLLNGKNEVAARLGDNPGIWRQKGWPRLPRESWEPSKFIAPHGAAWDAQGNFYIVEWTPGGRIHKWRKVM